MDTNIAAWMIGGGPHLETHAEQRDRQQLHAFLESQRIAAAARPSLIDRFRSVVRPASHDADIACCPA